jgi:hypothetical protein
MACVHDCFKHRTDQTSLRVTAQFRVSKVLRPAPSLLPHLITPRPLHANSSPFLSTGLHNLPFVTHRLPLHRRNITTTVLHQHTATIMPYLNDLLSQYECLLTICSNLSSADIVHLSTTCKENQTYITASEPIKKRLNDVACCDGNGIVAQARLFGYHGGPSLSKPEWECLGGISAPCTECGVKVCDVRALALDGTTVRYRGTGLTCVLYRCADSIADTSPMATRSSCSPGMETLIIQSISTCTRLKLILFAWPARSLRSCWNMITIEACSRLLNYARPGTYFTTDAFSASVEIARRNFPTIPFCKQATAANVKCGRTSWAYAGCAFRVCLLRRQRHTKASGGGMSWVRWRFK